VRALDLLAQEPRVDQGTLARVRELELRARDALAALAERVSESPLVTGLGVGMHRDIEAAQSVSGGKEAGHPLGWSPSTLLDLRSVKFLGRGETGELPTFGRKARSVVKIGLDVRAPARGDEATAVITVPSRVLGKNGSRIELLLKPHYKENRKFAGRMAYFVRVDGEEIIEHDATAWNENESLWIGVPAGTTSMKIEVGVRALRDCEPWGWGRATAITIRGVRVLSWESPRTDVVFGCSNPFAIRRESLPPSEVAESTVPEPVEPSALRSTAPVPTWVRYRRGIRRRARRALRYLGLVD
jgi:hypothetical protein